MTSLGGRQTVTRSNTDAGGLSREALIGAKIQPRPDGCWQWCGTDNGHGYGLVWDGHQSMAAHRYVWLTLRVEPIDGLVLHHECGNKGCVNPDHLTPMTQADHMAHHAEQAA